MTFTLEKTVQLEEIKSEGNYYTHPSGAQLIHIKNDDDNKVFSITFKTPVKDNTGVPHIIEHSILCGSEKYPIKDPFNELSKGTLYTFLNAMTFKDKTMYPVASCNEKDFYNLMDVYLDAVFKPLKREETFMQEGLNYSFDKDGKFSGFGGIVYNEMSGVYSEPLEVLSHKVYETLFNGTQYAFDSGGIPNAENGIKSLDYEEFLKFYEEHYSPANSYIYLYGNMDIDKCLEHIEEGYLSKIKDNGKNAEIVLAKPFDKPKYEEYTYECHSEESAKKYISANYVINGENGNKLMTGVSLLKYYLFGMDASPLRKALTDARLGDEVMESVDANFAQPTFGITIKNSEKDVKELKKIIDETLTQIVKEGFNEELLQACISKFEFTIREDNNVHRPKGLTYNIAVLSDWIYGGDCFEKVNRIKPLEEIKNDKQFLIDIINTHFLNNNHVVYATLSPKVVDGEPENYEVDEKTTALYKQKMEKLEEYRKMVDKQEDIEKIPVLALSDVDNTIKKMDVSVQKVDDTTVLNYATDTNGIIYLDFFYNTAGVGEELTPYIGILTYVLGKLDTENYTFAELQQSIGNDLGGFVPFSQAYTNVEAGSYEPLLVFKAKALNDKADKIFYYIKEVTENTKFSDHKRLEVMLKEYLSMYENAVINSGHSFASGRAQSYLQPSALYDDKISGMEFYLFLKDVVKKGDYKEIEKSLVKVSELIFNNSAFKLYVACDENGYDFIKDDIKKYAGSLREVKLEQPKEVKRPDAINEGFSTRSNVQYVAMAFDYSKTGMKYNGQLSVLASILNTDYLMDEVRIKGGAYGCFCSIYKKGIFAASSYRDPNLENTVEVYENIPEYLRSFNVGEREMRKYVLGTINKYIRPKCALERVDYAITAYLNGISHEMLTREVDEILHTTVADINALGEKLKPAFEDGVVCVVGNARKVKAAKEKFGKVVEL